jgi:hypothetical protein
MMGNVRGEDADGAWRRRRLEGDNDFNTRRAGRFQVAGQAHSRISTTSFRSSRCAGLKVIWL